MIPFLIANPWRAAALALLGLIVALLIQIHGVPLIGGGLVARLERMTELRLIERDNHRKTKAAYAQVMADAIRNEALRLKRVKAEQERINDRAQENFDHRLDALRARYDSLRGQGRKAAGSQGGAEPVPGLPLPAFGADAAPTADGLSAAKLSLAQRYQCSVGLTQLDELITWVEAQTKVKVND